MHKIETKKYEIFNPFCILQGTDSLKNIRMFFEKLFFVYFEVKRLNYCNTVIKKFKKLHLYKAYVLCISFCSEYNVMAKSNMRIKINKSSNKYSPVEGVQIVLSI